MLKKQAIVILVFLLSIAVLTACTPKAETENETTTTTTATTQATEAAPATTQATEEATTTTQATEAAQTSTQATEAAPTTAQVSEAAPVPTKAPASAPASTQVPVSAPQTDAGLKEIKDMLMKAADEVVVMENEVKFKDDSGREAITIKKNPKKVAVLYGSHACLYTEAGGKVSVGIGGAGAVTLYKEQIGRNILEDEGVVTIATSSSGKNWNIENILAQQPDLIICSTAMNGYSTIAAPAEAANIPVIALTYSGAGDYFKWSRVFSNINSKPELWDCVAAVTADEIANIILKAPNENNPRVLSLLPQVKGIEANFSGSDMGVIIKQLKGINVADKLSSDSSVVRVAINLEEIYAAKPEMIFIQCIGSEEEARASLESITKGNPVWENIEAVKNGKVYYMPKELFHNRPNRQYNESYRMLAELLYPDIKF